MYYMPRPFPLLLLVLLCLPPAFWLLCPCSFIAAFAQGVTATALGLPVAAAVCPLIANYLVDQKWAIDSSQQLTDNVTALTNNLQVRESNETSW
jgi:hypothetical protein